MFRGSKGTLPWWPVKEAGAVNRKSWNETIRLKEYNALASDWFDGISAEAVFYHAAFAVVNKKTLNLPLAIASGRPVVAVRTDHGSLWAGRIGRWGTKGKDFRPGSAPVGMGKSPTSQCILCRLPGEKKDSVISYVSLGHRPWPVPQGTARY